jgi:outer membrane protein assembly factor BamB
MHSDVGHLLDGRSAATLWTRDKAELPGEFRWGYAGVPLAAADVNADGLDELVCLYPVCFWTAEGRTGRITAGKKLASRRSLPAWAAYGEPMVCDFNGDGRLEVLLDSPYLLALLDMSGKPLWHGRGRADFPVGRAEDNVGQTTNCKHALVDIEGDGKFEIASAGYGDGVRLIDAGTGKVLWSLAAPAPTGPRVTAANIDGRGGDEILYPAGNTLVVITGDRTSGRVLWTWEAPAALGLPAIADVDGDGLAEIVVQDAAGTVHCLAAMPRP